MAGGRPRKPVSQCTGQMSKAEKEERLEQEEKLKAPNDKVEAPSWLSEEAKKEFERVSKDLVKLDLIANIDTAILAIYADAYSNYVHLTKEIQKVGTVMEYTNAGGNTNKTVTAEVLAQNKYIDVIMKCSSKLGLSISDRLKLIVPTKEDKPKNKFADFLGED